MSQRIITGKVADVLDNRTVALNIGLKDGVEAGMAFEITEPDTKKIIDPDTKEELGTTTIVKAQVRVIHVEEKFSIAETYNFREINVGGVNTLGNLSNIFAPPKYVKQYETFEIDEHTKKKIDQSKSRVKVGDLVTSLPDNAV